MFNKCVKLVSFGFVATIGLLSCDSASEEVPGKPENKVSEKFYSRKGLRFNDSIVSFGKGFVAGSGLKKFEFKNTGDKTVMIKSVTVDGDDKDNFKILGYPESLKKGNSGAIKVEFLSKSKGPKKAMLVISTDKGPVNIPLLAQSDGKSDDNGKPNVNGGNNGKPNVNGGNNNKPDVNTGKNNKPNDNGTVVINGKLELSKKVLDFGSVESGEEKILSFDVINGTKEPVVFNSLSFSENGLGDFYSPFNVARVDSGKKVAVKVRYRPSEYAVKNSVLKIGTSQGTRAIAIKAKCIDLTSPTLTLSQTDFDFGQVTSLSSKTLNLKITNEGFVDLLIDSIDFLGGDSSDFDVENKDYKVPPGKSIEVPLTFNAKIAGVKETRVQIISNTDTKFINLLGFAKPMILSSSISVDKTNLIFSGTKIGEVSELVINITNNSMSEKYIKPLSILGGDRAQFSVAEEGFKLSAKESKKVTVFFKPKSEKSKSAILKIKVTDKEFIDVGLNGSVLK